MNRRYCYPYIDDTTVPALLGSDQTDFRNRIIANINAGADLDTLIALEKEASGKSHWHRGTYWDAVHQLRAVIQVKTKEKAAMEAAKAQAAIDEAARLQKLAEIANPSTTPTAIAKAKVAATYAAAKPPSMLKPILAIAAAAAGAFIFG